MSISNGIISAPISANEPYDLLGVPKQKSGWDIGYICKNDHGRINKWSKFAPIENSQLTPLSDTQFEAASYGFNPVGTSLVRSFPKGGTTSPYRLTDFNKYNHTAINGLVFKQETYTVDLLDSSGANGVTVSLHADINLITLKSFVNTLFKGKSLLFRAYANSIFYEFTETLSTSDLSFTVPRSKLLEIDVADDGRVSVSIQPIGHNQNISITAYLKITAKTKYSITGWSYSMLIGTSTSNWIGAFNYMSGATSKYLDLNGGKSLYIYDLGMLGAAYNTVYLTMRYTDSSEVVQVKRINLRHNGNPNWSGNTGGTWSVTPADIPIIHPSTFKAVDVYITGKAKDYAGVDRIVRITNIVRLNISKKA